jgi:hypothetical protein
MDRTPNRMGRGVAGGLLSGVAALLLLATSVLPAAAGGTVAVTSADWKPERAVLRIEGTSTKPDAVILVKDADSRALLGSAAVRADGKWLLKIRKPDAVPARLMAVLGSQYVECDVIGSVAAR